MAGIKPWVLLILFELYNPLNNAFKRSRILIFLAFVYNLTRGTYIFDILLRDEEAEYDKKDLRGKKMKMCCVHKMGKDCVVYNLLDKHFFKHIPQYLLIL